MKAFLLHVGISPYNNNKVFKMANPCFRDGSFIFVPWCTGDDHSKEAQNQTEYQYLNHPFGLRELLQLHPAYGRRTLRFKTQNNPEFVNFTFVEWFRAPRTARLFPLMSMGHKVYFAASFVKIGTIPSLQEFVEAPERYRVPTGMCFLNSSYSKDGFIGVFAHFTIEEILGNEKYRERYSNAQNFEDSQWNSLCRNDVLIRGSAGESRYWSRVVRIGKGNEPTGEFEAFYQGGQIPNWSGVFDGGTAERLQSYFGAQACLR